MRKIKLTDGTEYVVDRCGATADSLLINITSSVTMVDAVNTFSQPSLTERIEHFFEGTTTDHHIFEGYTRLASSSLSPTGVSLMLQRGET